MAAIGLQTSWRAHPKQFAHQQSQVPGDSGNKKPLLNFVQAAKPSPTCAARVAQMREAPLDAFTSFALQFFVLAAFRSFAVVQERLTLLLVELL